jgi:hypothetical protein
MALEHKTFFGIMRAMATEHQCFDIAKEHHRQTDPDPESNPELADEHTCEERDKYADRWKEKICQVGWSMDAQQLTLYGTALTRLARTRGRSGLAQL